MTRNSYEFQTVQFGLNLDVEVIFYPAEPENGKLEPYCEIQSVQHKGVEWAAADLHTKQSFSYYTSVASILEEAAFEASRKEKEADGVEEVEQEYERD